MDRFKKLSLAVGVLIIFLCFGWLRVDAKEKTILQKLANPRTHSTSSLPFELGIQKGLYLKEGIELDLLILTGNLSMSGLRAGEIDYVTALGRAIRASGVGMPFRTIIVITDKIPHSLVSKPEIKSGKDLKGKVIGVGTLGSTEHFSAKEIVKYFGLNPDKDVTVISTANPDLSLPALISGSVDAIIIGPPAIFLAKRRGFIELARVVDVVEAITPTIGLATTTKNIKESPQTVKKMVRASLKTLLYMKDKDNRKEIVAFIRKSWGADADIAEGTYDSALRGLAKDGSTPDKAVQNELELGRLAGVKIPEVATSQIVDFSILREVQNEMADLMKKY